MNDDEKEPSAPPDAPRVYVRPEMSIAEMLRRDWAEQDERARRSLDAAADSKGE